MANLTLSILELIVLMLGAIVLGITIHFFIISRRNLSSSLVIRKKTPESGFNEWKLKYFNEIETKQKELITLRKRADEAEENNNINSIEAEELRKENKRLQAELKEVEKAAPADSEANSYLDQLYLTQQNLLAHHEKITHLLGNIDVIRESEEKQKEIQRSNEEMSAEVMQLRQKLAAKDKEIGTVRQQATLSKEMTSMLDNAYTEFGSLQEKIQKLETQVGSSKIVNVEFEDLKEEHVRLRREFEEQRTRLNNASTDNREMKAGLMEAEEKLREANFQRQQLQKRVSYLEEMTNDLQDVSDANKRLESQIKRIGELESMLNVVSEQRDELAKKSN